MGAGGLTPALHRFEAMHKPHHRGGLTPLPAETERGRYERLRCRSENSVGAHFLFSTGHELVAMACGLLVIVVVIVVGGICAFSYYRPRVVVVVVVVVAVSL